MPERLNKRPYVCLAVVFTAHRKLGQSIYIWAGPFPLYLLYHSLIDLPTLHYYLLDFTTLNKSPHVIAR